MGLRDGCFLLAQFEMLVMLYLHGGGLQLFALLSVMSWLHLPEQVEVGRTILSSEIHRV